VPDDRKKHVALSIINLVDFMSADNPANGFEGRNLLKSLRQWLFQEEVIIANFWPGFTRVMIS